MIYLDDPLKQIFAMLFSVFLRNPHSSSRDVSKALFTPKTTILRVLTGPGWDFTRPDGFHTGFQRSKKSIESPLRRTCYK
jgi:hypothetical protein